MTNTAFSLTLGTLTFLITVVWGPPLIRRLRALTIAPTTKHVPAEEADAAEQRLFTPVLGGVMILVPVMVVTVGLNIATLVGPDLSGESILLPLLVMLAFGVIGAVDDWETMRGIRAEGLSPRWRIVAQAVVALAAALVLFFLLDIRSIALPTVDARFDLGPLYIPIAALLIFAMSNAFDLTDGVNGLTAIIATMGFVAYGIIAIQQGQVFLVQFCLTMVGALVAFLWFNIHPAQLALGDSGALMLGATLAATALLTGQWLILPIIAIVPAAEAISVFIQIAAYYVTRAFTGEGQFLFQATPLHHHFEVLGWSQVQIFQRFWIVQILACTVGVALALL